MNFKILVFSAWVIVGFNFFSFLALLIEQFPNAFIPFLAVLTAIFAVAVVVGFFAASTRPWIALGGVILFIGGLFAWLL